MIIPLHILNTSVASQSPESGYNGLDDATAVDAESSDAPFPSNSGMFEEPKEAQQD